MIKGPEDLKDRIYVDREKKRIYIVFEGFLSLEDAVKLKQAYQDGVSKVGQGYTVLSFFKDFVPANDEIQDVFMEMIKMARAGGCKKAARIGSGSVLGPLQMGRLANVEHGYPSRHAKTWEEAEAYLDSDEV